MMPHAPMLLYLVLRSSVKLREWTSDFTVGVNYDRTRIVFSATIASPPHHCDTLWLRLHVTLRDTKGSVSDWPFAVGILLYRLP